MGPKVETCTGSYIDPMDFTSSEVELEHVAHALSMKTRFTGHSQRFMSIAEHCVNVSYLVPEPAAKLVALFHEGDEVFGPDISSPMKQHPVFDAYKEYANKAAEQVYRRFVPIEWVHQYHEMIKLADTVMLVAEAKKGLLSYDTPGQWEWTKEITDRAPEMLVKAMLLQVDSRQAKAKAKFLVRYKRLMGQRVSTWESLRAAF